MRKEWAYFDLVSGFLSEEEEEENEKLQQISERKHLGVKW